MTDAKTPFAHIASSLRRLAVLAASLSMSSMAVAAGGSVGVVPAGNDVDNIQSLQRGARNFINYCTGCHSAEYVRYNTLARDLDLTDDQIAANLMFNAERRLKRFSRQCAGKTRLAGLARHRRTCR